LIREDPLIRAGLDELAHPETTGVASRFAGWQRVVGADYLVAIGYVGSRASEQRAIVFHVLEKVLWLTRFRQRREIDRVGLSIPGMPVELGPDLPANQIVLTIADRDIARIIKDQKYDWNIVHDTHREFLHTHHEVAIPDDAHNGHVGLGQFRADSGDENEPDVM